MDRRCDSVGDRGTRKSSGLIGGMTMVASMPAKPKPEPIEIKIDLECILPPAEDAAAVANAFMVWRRDKKSSNLLRLGFQTWNQGKITK